MNTETKIKELSSFEETLEYLEQLLIKHDKFYESTDDHARFKRGEQEYKVIDKLAKQLKLAGYAIEVQELFTKYYSNVY